MLGDVLKRELSRLTSASIKKTATDSFWVILRDIALKEIIELNDPVDSDVIIPLYYSILKENLSFIPAYYREIVPSNKQERYRLVIRNLFSSNAFHTDGLANQFGIVAYKEPNENKKGHRIVYKKA